MNSLLRELGLGEADTVMVHSSLFSLGKLEDSAHGFLDEILKIIGPDGTLVVPTFTFSYRRNEIFDVIKTPADWTIGLLAELVRNDKRSIRSADPLFSMAAIGPKAAALMDRGSKSCFGNGSIYGKLFDENALFLGIGLTYSTGLTGFLHIEKLAGVPYRLDIEFYGKTRLTNHELVNDSAIHFARNEEIFGEALCNREPIGRKMEAKGISKKVFLGYGDHIGIRGSSWRDFLVQTLQSDPLTMLLQPATLK